MSLPEEETQGHMNIEKSMWGHSIKIAIYESRREASGETKPDNTLILNFQAPELWEINFCCLSRPTLWYLLRQPEQTNTENDSRQMMGPSERERTLEWRNIEVNPTDYSTPLEFLSLYFKFEAKIIVPFDMVLNVYSGKHLRQLYLTSG